jgi:hypothetical protein
MANIRSRAKAAYGKAKSKAKSKYSKAKTAVGEARSGYKTARSGGSIQPKKLSRMDKLRGKKPGAAPSKAKQFGARAGTKVNSAYKFTAARKAALMKAVRASAAKRRGKKSANTAV